MKFLQGLVDRLQQLLGDGYVVQARTYSLNNGVETHAVFISAEGVDIAEGIPVDIYYGECQGRADLDAIARDMLRTYRGKEAQSVGFHIGRLYDWNHIKDKVMFRLVNSDANRALLRGIPHFEICNLSQVFYVLLDIGEGYNKSMLINNRLMDIWGVSAACIQKQARRNTPARLPGVFMDEGLHASSNFMDVFRPGKSMHFLSNCMKVYGAACIMYEGMLEGIAERLGLGFYVLPSSLHVVMLIPTRAYNQGHAGRLKQLVNAINLEEVPKQDVLSDCVYFYDKEERQLSIANMTIRLYRDSIGRDTHGVDMF